MGPPAPFRIYHSRGTGTVKMVWWCVGDTILEVIAAVPSLMVPGWIFLITWRCSVEAMSVGLHRMASSLSVEMTLMLRTPQSFYLQHHPLQHLHSNCHLTLAGMHSIFNHILQSNLVIFSGACSIEVPSRDSVIITGGHITSAGSSFVYVYTNQGYKQRLPDLQEPRYFHTCGFYHDSNDQMVSINS